MAETTPKKFYRSKSDRKIAGVCGGVANYFGMDPTLVRILWIVSIFLGGLGLIAYVVFWLVAPEQ